MKPLFIDTNIFLRILTKDNKRMFDECMNLLMFIKTGKIESRTSTLVLSEIVWTLGTTYNFSRKRIADAIKSIINVPEIKVVEGHEIMLATEFFEKYSVKFIDSLIASIPGIQSGEWTIVSYDKDFDKLGIKRVEPSDIINRG
jgi:predicted nucleic-acid-binding protein